MRHEFLIEEYRQACSAYFKGVDIGIVYIKIFFVVNGVLLAAIGVKNSIAEGAQAVGAGGTIDVLKDMDLTSKAPWVGLLFSFLLSAIVPFYSRQLKNCAERCRAIELRYGGELFGAIETTSTDGKRWITTMMGIHIIAALPAMFWIYVLLNVYGTHWSQWVLQLWRG